jgi:hypothetical protein
VIKKHLNKGGYINENCKVQISLIVSITLASSSVSGVGVDNDPGRRETI